MTENTSTIPASRLTVSKVDVKSGCIYIKLLWEQDPNELFRIHIFESDNRSWSGSFTYENARQCRESFDIEDENQYKMSVKEALIGVSDCYVFDFDVNKGEFRWKKKFPDSAVVEHGRVTVHKDDVPTSIHTLVDILLEQNQSLLNIIQEYSKNHMGLEAELDLCKHELDNFIDTKISLEETMYGKFLQLLNEKKRRITMLDEAIKSMDS
ncbi:uncharacterized protein LOC106129316 [Amyelois transitella]|uniref:uncharacterized protein LOC106129316 n=1 Tax=Amyelois transitella TaxID=680683 RepID=UPI00299003CA|nr:uncharacterized protein LOC106129316 [Amyelois transitella]